MTDTPPPLLNYPGPAVPPPLAFTPDHLAAIAEAKKRFAPIRREISVANFDAWSVAIFGGLTALFSLTSLPGLLVGIGMGAIAFVEFRAVKRLHNLDPSAPRTLALNQFCFAGGLILYALYNLIFPGSGMSEEVAQLTATDPQIAKTFADLTGTITPLLYGGVILFALAFQGGCGLYHLTRIRTLQRYRESTAPWLLNLHPTGIMN